MGSEAENKATKIKRNKKIVDLSSYAAALFVSIYLYASYNFKLFPALEESKASLINRVVFALRWQLPGAFFVLATIITIARIRYYTPAANPVESQSQDPVLIPGKILQNSVEQFLINAFVILTLSTILEASSLHMIPAYSILFLIGRFVFAVGYLIDPMQRSLGIAINFLSIVPLTLFCLYRLCSRGFTQNLVWLPQSRQ